MILRFWRARSNTEHTVSAVRPLSKLRPGESGTVLRIASAAPERVVRLSSLGVVPGARITLVQRNPAVVLQIAETTIAIDGEVADDILVAPAAP